MVTYLWYAEGQSKILSKGGNPEIVKGNAIFLYGTHPLNLIRTAIKFYQDIPYGYLLMAYTSIL